MYPDNNCNVEMYCNDKIVELESLGALTRLNPGVSLQHMEVWDVSSDIDYLLNGVQKLLNSPEVK